MVGDFDVLEGVEDFGYFVVVFLQGFVGMEYCCVVLYGVLYVVVDD